MLRSGQAILRQAQDERNQGIHRLCNRPGVTHAYPLSGGGMSEAGFPGFDGLSGLRSSDGSVAPNPAHPINPVNLASDKLPKWLTRTQFVIARSEVRRWRMAISFQERRSLPRRDCHAALAMTVWGKWVRVRWGVTHGVVRLSLRGAWFASGGWQSPWRRDTLVISR